MSFSDLERGEGSAPTRNGGLQSAEDRELSALTHRISLHIFKINSNVTGIVKCIDMLGTSKDTPAVRKQLTNLTDVTREIVKDSTVDVKKLAAYAAGTPKQKMEQAKVSRDFQAAALTFQRAQRRSAEKQRQYVDRAKASLAEAESSELTPGPPLTPRKDSQLVELEEHRPQQAQQLTQVEALSDAEVEFQEQMIEEREEEIREIESGIHELNEIFRDLGTIVHEQQSMLDNIESNVIAIANDTENASSELTTAHRYQRKAGRRLFCLLMIFCIVLAVVLIAILI